MSKATRRSVKASPTKEQQVEETSGQQTEVTMSPAETAQYIAEFTAELSFLAKRSQLNLLAYLLDVARLESIRSLRASERKQ
jgi:uncharacterized membrane protein